MSNVRRWSNTWLRIPAWEPSAIASESDPDSTRAAIIAPLEDERRRLRFLGVLNRAWLAFGGVALATIPIYSYWQISVAIGAGTLITYLTVQTLLHRQQLRAACIAFCVCADATFFGMFLILSMLLGAEEAFRTEGPVLMLMGIVTLFGGALIGPRASIAIAAINTVVIIGTRLLLSPEVEPRPSTIVFGWLLAAIAYLYETSLRDVFAQLRGVRLGLESTILERTRDLRDSIANLETLATQLTNANRDLELFSASVAHDLRSPLRMIEGYSRLLQQDFAAKNPNAAEALQRMMQVESRMSRLIDGLLAFARLGHHELEKRPIDMNALAQRIAGELREQEPARILTIDVGSLPSCNADAILIEQVLVNLLANAVKFTRPRSVAQITVRGWETDAECVYSVKDNGVGFAMEQVGRLFNTLQRLHADEEFEGTGIGLATVQRVMQRQGGRVWAQGEPGSGAEFFFAIPK